MESLFIFRQFLPAFFFLITLVSSSTFASIETTAAWLKSQQRNDGGFSGAHSQATEYQVTVEALLALHQVSRLDNANAQAGGEFLQTELHGQLEEVSSNLRLQKINPIYFPNSTTPLAEYKSASGGYGDYPGYESAVSTTAILAYALTPPDTQLSANTHELIAYLLAKQRSDKGWAEESNRSSIYVTALVSRALQAHRFTFNLSTSISSATEYLLANQQPGGGWSGNLESTIALLAVIPAVTDPSRYKNALDKLIAAQLSNGSWDNDVYTTALALQVLYLVKNPPIIDVPTTGAISGSVINAASNLPIALVQILLDGPTDLTLATDSSGRFSANNVPSGNYRLTYTATGFQQTIQEFQIAAGDHIDFGIIKLNALPTSVLVHGQVTDFATGLPLSNVVIQFTGNQNLQATTDQTGRYALELAPGEVSISISQSGYQPINGSVNAAAGAQIDFSPALQAQNATPNTTILLHGLIVDAQSNTPLSGAVIHVASTAIFGVSGTDGSFSLSGLSEGAIQVEVTLSGYQTASFTGTALANSVIELGAVRLIPVVLDHSTLYGQVVDADTGIPIANAIVIAEGETTHSNADGSYELNNIHSDIFALSASADGYQQANSQIHIAEYGRVQLDIPLQKIKVSNVALKQLLLDKLAYGAYESVKLNGTIHNQGIEAEEIILQAQVVNPVGIVIEEFTISHDATAGEQVWPLAPNQESGFTMSWATQSYSPGQYKLLLAAYSNATHQLLDQQQLTANIQPTAKIASLKLGATVDNLNQGSTHDVGFTAAIRNQSNIPVSLQISYDLSDPENTVIFTEDAAIHIEPTQLFATFDLDTHTQLFGKSGSYKLRILGIESIQPALIEAATINIIPNININIEQAITPSVVVPGTSERVHVKIRLEGTEVAQ